METALGPGIGIHLSYHAQVVVGMFTCKKIVSRWQGRPKAAVREEAKTDRKKTRNIASVAMRKLVEYGFIKQTQPVNP